MKNWTYLFILLLLIGYTGFSQDKAIKITYLEARPIPEQVTKGIPEHLKDQVIPVLKKKYEKKMSLMVTGIESSYAEEESINELNDGNVNIITADSKGDALVLFKNLNEKAQVTQYELGGKKFLVEKELPEISWEIMQDEKQIGSYTAQKAQATIYGSLVTAWFTNALPISTGPNDLYGLPGLILEVRYEDNASIVAIEVTKNLDLSVEIPQKGKVVTEKEFEELKIAYAENLKNMYGGTSGTTVISN